MTRIKIIGETKMTSFSNGRSSHHLSHISKLTKPFSLPFLLPPPAYPTDKKERRPPDQELIQVEKRHDLPKVLGLLACLHQQLAVMEREADHLLDLRDDVHVA